MMFESSSPSIIVFEVNEPSPLQAELIARAVWDAPLALHTTTGTYGWFVKKLLTFAKFLALKD